MGTEQVRIPESEAEVGIQIAKRQGMSLEELVALLLCREVCHTQPETDEK